MEPYHRQPPAKKADSKLKKEKKDGPYPPTISIVPYRLNRAQEKKKPVQSRHPPQDSTQINSTGPTLHKGEPHTEEKNMTQPARENSQEPSTSKNKQNKRRG